MKYFLHSLLFSHPIDQKNVTISEEHRQFQFNIPL